MHYLRKKVTYLDDGNAAIEVGVLPAGALILKAISGVQVETAFNGATTNDLDIGVEGTVQKWAGDLALGAKAFVPFDVADANQRVDVATKVIAGVVSTANASAGEAEIVIAYTMP